MDDVLQLPERLLDSVVWGDPVGDEHASPGLLVHLLGRKLENVIILIHELFLAFAVLVVLQSQNEALSRISNLHDRSNSLSFHLINTGIPTTTAGKTFSQLQQGSLGYSDA